MHGQQAGRQNGTCGQCCSAVTYADGASQYLEPLVRLEQNSASESAAFSSKRIQQAVRRVV